MLSRPNKRRFLALDEPFKMVSKDYVPLLRDLLLTLSKEMRIQILMVTHNPGLAIGKVIELS